MAYAALFSSIIFGLIHEFAGNHTSYVTHLSLDWKIVSNVVNDSLSRPTFDHRGIPQYFDDEQWSRWLVEYRHPRSCIRVRRRIPCAGTSLWLRIWIVFLKNIVLKIVLLQLVSYQTGVILSVGLIIFDLFWIYVVDLLSEQEKNQYSITGQALSQVR